LWYLRYNHPGVGQVQPNLFLSQTPKAVAGR
jgi:hypothetical protein